MNYDKKKLAEYYQSPAWQEKRSERLKIDGFKCAKCGFTRALEVHHINYERIYNEDVNRDLITLCKKCHNEIEAQKKAINPIPAEHHFVYLAGKISKYDWRGAFYDYRSVSLPFTEREYTEKVNDNLSVTGPFFISCDHGCYHGEQEHGAGATSGGCMGDYYTRNDVFEICKSQIAKAEIVVAYIDCRDCYGTIAEIGYAHAIGKDIFIIFANAELKEEMWFVDKMQRNTEIASPTWISEQIYTRFKHGKPCFNTSSEVSEGEMIPF